MMKRGMKYIWLIGILLLFVIGTVSLSYAWEAVHTIEYDYMTDCAVPELTLRDGKIFSEGDVTVTTFDIIYRAASGELNVQQNIALPADGYVLPDDYDTRTIIRVLPVDTEYGSGEETIRVHYTNEYIYSMRDLEVANSAKAYNNIFEYLTRNSQSKVLTSRILCLMRDLEIDDFTVNYPCSVELLTSKLTLPEGAHFTIAHSHPGVYYVRSDAENSIVTPNPGVGETRFAVQAPKATYVCDAALPVGQAVTPADVLTMALDFACSLIPHYPAKNMLLQSEFKTYGVKLSYTMDGEPFDGILTSDMIGQEKTITVKATYGDAEAVTSWTMKPIDLQNGTHVCEALIDMVSRYGASGPLTSGFDLGSLLRELFGASLPSGKTLSVFLTDGSGLPYTDENATSLRMGNDPSTPLDRVDVSGDISALSLYVRKGTVNISESLALYFVYGDEPAVEKPTLPSVMLSLAPADPDEVIYYLKSKTPAFITNRAYGVLNVNTDSTDTIANGIHIGTGENSLLTAADFGITQIIGQFGGTDTTSGSSLTHEFIRNTYFGSMVNYTYTLKNKTVMLDPNHLVTFTYTVTFGDDEENPVTRQFTIPVYRAALGAGGESEMFTSDNQLASYFISEDTNWLAPTDLDLVSHFYTLLEISEINDIPFGDIDDANSIKSLLTLNGSSSCPVTDEGYGFEDEPFFSNYQLLVNPNFIPARNTAVTIHCYLYDSETESSNKISEFNYTIVIPGILKCPSNAYEANWPGDAERNTPYTFTDKNFYDKVVGILPAEYTSEVLCAPDDNMMTSVVLSSATNYEGNRKIDLNLTLEKDTSDVLLGTGNAGYQVGTAYNAMVFAPGGTIGNVTGIQVFERIQAVILDGITITDDIYAFSDYKGLTLKYISMKGCGLTDAKVYNANRSALSGLYITAINLANNALTRVDGLLMRTVQTLDLSGNNIGVIDGLEKLTDLKWLDISENAIKRFEPLKKLEYLKTVFVTGNYISDAVYGSSGVINIPVYVWVMKTNGALLYAAAGNTGVPCGAGSIYGYALSDNEIVGSVALNAFASPTVLNPTQAGYLTTDLTTSVEGFTFKFITRAGNETTALPLYEDNGNETISAECTCYYKIAIYKGGIRLAQREFCVRYQPTSSGS